MKRAHEEIWTGNKAAPCDGYVETEGCGYIDIPDCYVDLVAAAPAMARMLLEFYREGDTDGNCPSEGCGRFVGTLPDHGPRCPLVALLRSAGVLP